MRPVHSVHERSISDLTGFAIENVVVFSMIVRHGPIMLPTKSLERSIQLSFDSNVGETRLNPLVEFRRLTVEPGSGCHSERVV